MESIDQEEGLGFQECTGSVTRVGTGPMSAAPTEIAKAISFQQETKCGARLEALQQKVIVSGQLANKNQAEKTQLRKNCLHGTCICQCSTCKMISVESSATGNVKHSTLCQYLMQQLLEMICRQFPQSIIYCYMDGILRADSDAETLEEMFGETERILCCWT